MRIKQMTARSLWMLLFALLAACGTAPTPKVDNADATKIVATFMAQITQTAAAAGNLPAATEPTDTESPEESETPAPSATPDPYKALLDRFRMVSVIKGNLFVRDGMGLPVQITKSGTDHDPVISADGEKIAFYRGDGNYEVFVVNADGSGEKALINKKLVPALGTGGEAKFSTFRARTHELFFQTNVCGGSFCLVSSFTVDVDTTKITEFISGFKGSAEISPNGQYLSIIDSGQVNLRSADGKVIHQNIISASGKALPLQYWLPDSSGLVLVVSTDTLINSYSIWRYTLKDDRAQQISLAVAPTASCIFSISPDRNWLLYQDGQQKSYLGSLKDSLAQPYDWNSDCSINAQWSPDSQHFASQTAIGSVDGTPSISLDGHFITWLDATHYLFTKGKSILDLQNYITEVGKELDAVQTNFSWSPVYAVLP